MRALRERSKEGLLRELAHLSILPGGDISINGREYVNFSSNDYLALSAHPALINAAREALSGMVGTASSRLMSGSMLIHKSLEERTAVFKDKPSALVFNSGYQANVGIISAFLGKDDCIFSDRLNHASIVDGIRLSGAKMFRFRHNDAEHLGSLLEKERGKCRNALIVTETVFSMDGDRAPLKDMAALKKEYDCMFMVDEAHATGILGKKGSGLAEETGTGGDIDIIMGTFSKALGSFGAYAAMSGALREYLVNTCRSFIYSTALPPAIIAANIKAIELVESEPSRRGALLENAGYFRERLLDKGLTVPGASQIIPIIVGETHRANALSEALKEKGWWVPSVRPPTVPNGEARLRISLTYNHSKGIIDGFLRDLGSLI